MAKKYIVELKAEERDGLKQQLKKGKVGVRIVKRAQILLAADTGHTDTHIAETVQVAVTTVERIRKRFVQGGVEHA